MRNFVRNSECRKFESKANENSADGFFVIRTNISDIIISALIFNFARKFKNFSAFGIRHFRHERFDCDIGGGIRLSWLVTSAYPITRERYGVRLRVLPQ